MKPIFATRQVLDQIKSLTDLLSPQQYKKPLSVLNQSSVGQHVRHVLEFYQCLLLQWKTGVVCYDHRARSVELEEDIPLIQEVIEQLCSDISSVDPNAALIMRTQPLPDSEEQIAVTTSIGRELLYGLDHAIHHLALVKIGIQQAYPDVAIDPNLGVAPSTIKHRTACAH